MKKFRYLLLVLFVGLVAASCNKKEVTYPWDEVGPDQAQVQIFYMAPITSVAANYIYELTLNGKVYENNGAALISAYQGTPGGQVGIYYAVKAGTVSIEMKAGANKTPVYSNTFTVQGGKRYQVVVADVTKAPYVIEAGEIPTITTTETAEYCAVRFFNFMFEDGKPTTDRLQLRLQNTTTKEYENVGDPVEFGEAGDWFTPSVIKTTINSSGSQRRDLDFIVIDQDGKVKGNLETTKSSGAVSKFTDYWTLAIGRGYHWYIYGDRTSKTTPVAIRQWTMR